MNARRYFPPLLNEIADVAGVEVALAIADARGGTRVHFPASAPPGHWLYELVGEAAVAALCEHFRVTARGGVFLDVPKGPTKLYARARLQAAELLDRVSASEAALSVGVSERCIRNWWAAERRDREKAERVPG